MERVIKQIIAGIDRNLALTQDQREVAEYALYSILMTAGTLLGALGIGGAAGVFPESAAALFTGAVFRWSAGGAHFSSPGRCMVVSIAFPVFAALASGALGRLSHAASLGRAVLALAAALFTLSVVIIGAYAPAETENKPIPPCQRPRLRALAYATLAGWAAIVYLLYRKETLSLIIASCLGLAWQMMSVTPVGYKVFRRIDTILGASNIPLRKGESE